MARRSLQRLCSDDQNQWRSKVKQVTKANFSLALEEIKTHINCSDFIAVSSQKTGAFSSPWRRPLPFDTPEIAYRKAKDAAEKFEILQFAVCPFRIQGSKIVAYPYNFHLFPRDELNLNMPSYSFACQTSFLESMTRQGVDFNVSIYEGISYLSRVQETKAKNRISDPIPSIISFTSSSSPSVSDAIFMERIKSRIKYWRDSCRDSGKAADEVLVSSLRKIILGSEVYGSRPCISLDVCNDGQVQLINKVVKSFCGDLVPLVIPDRSGGPKTVKVVLTSSEEDMTLLKTELQNHEEEQNKQIRGFREVIDAMSNSHKPIVACNCLNDFTFIHSKFVAPLPPSMAEFLCSLKLVFSNIVDLNHLWKEIGSLKKANNISAASNYLNRQFFVPFDMEIPLQAEEEEQKHHGYNVVRITNLFAKLASMLRLSPDSNTMLAHQSIEDFSNIFYPCSIGLEEPTDEDEVLMKNVKKVNTDDLVFLWGFTSQISAGELKRQLSGAHSALSADFELRLVNRSCAILVFWTPGLAKALLQDIGSGAVESIFLRELMSEGLKATGYEAYKRVCNLGIPEADLADCLDKVLAEATDDIIRRREASEIYWSSEDVIRLNEL
ncbi:poly(A)-specific ribonuclease PARN-like [Aristolochia californica]|uniref:poly(A)-specific ribonuclease PARN-like n=1 Tax=Aristolochia californica TaxID=171875 RepID=UPI0035DB9068